MWLPVLFLNVLLALSYWKVFTVRLSSFASLAFQAGK